MQYRPALRFNALAWAYDPVAMRVVRARRWRTAVVDAVAPLAGQRILDLGCGTGDVCIALKARCPGATVLGIDPDPAMLVRARRKADTAGLDLGLIRASATALPLGPPPGGAVDVCTTSLMLHHLDRAGKRSALAEAYRVLKPGGRLVIADWGPPRTMAGRLGFLVTQLFDGFETTRDHAGAAFPELISAAGLRPVEERGRWATAVGVVCLYCARKPDRSDCNRNA